jgi:anaerobic magnesium-protoporphyrin IX monomethyl ester cyclase
MIDCLLVASSKITGYGAFLMTLPNGGLSSIAANVNREICRVKILDLVAVRFKAKSYFKKYIQRNHFDVIGFSCMVFQYAEMLELAKIAKEVLPNVKTILGGYHATVAYDEVLNSGDIDYFDFVVSGEGELTFARIVEAIHQGKGCDDIPGVSFKKNGKIVHNPAGELINLDELKIPDRNSRVIKNRAFRVFCYQGDVVETTRGCTFTCNYCTITKMYGRSFRKYRIERILQDVEDARDHGAQAIFFTDDNIVLNRVHFEELCHGLIDRGLNNIKYLTQASVQGFSRSPHLAALARQAGFEWVFLGIESDSDDSLKFFNKDNQFEASETEVVVKALQDQGMFVVGGFIVGNPSDDRASLWRTYEYTKKLKMDMALFFTLTPYPGTELREELLKRNYITNLYDYSYYDCVNVNIRTDHLGSYELFRVIDSINHKTFTDGGVLQRIVKKYPLFTLKTFVKMVYHYPDWVFHHFTQGRFLERKRRKEYQDRALLSSLTSDESTDSVVCEGRGGTQA